MITTQCRYCGHRLEFDESLIGKKGRCPACTMSQKLGEPGGRTWGWAKRWGPVILAIIGLKVWFWLYRGAPF